jgi:hypothetical protein
MAEGFAIDDMVDIDGAERNGRLVSLHRRLKVSGVNSLTPNAAIAAILADPGIPAAGSTIIVNGSLLYLVGRTPRMTESHDLAEVDLFYEGGGTGSSSGEVRRGGRGGLSQRRVKHDRDGNEIVVRLGDTIFVREQRVEASVYLPDLMPWIETIENTSTPDALAALWLGRVNSAPWRGINAGGWLVDDVQYYELNASANLWRFRWVFHATSDPLGWNPVVAYTDPETGRMPTNLVQGVGVKQIPWYYGIDFNSKFT